MCPETIFPDSLAIQHANLRKNTVDGQMNTHHIPVNASLEEQFQIGFERGFENGLRASPGGVSGWEEPRVTKDDSMVGEYW